MNKLEKQCRIVKNVEVSSTVTQFLQQQYDVSENTPNKKGAPLGGITKNLKYAWIASGPKFQVIEVENGTRIASWLFGDIIREKRARVTCVAEFTDNFGSRPLFVIGLDCDVSGGMICVFDIMGSKIIRTLHLDDGVCHLHIVDSGDNIPGILKSLDGILAVGTCGGDTYLVDLCKHIWITDTQISNEQNYHKLFKRSCGRINLGLLESFREHAVANDEHLALQLNGSGVESHLFMLRTPQGQDALRIPREKVRVTSLLYVPKLISLLVGYNFGAWQIYNLLTLELEYTSAVYEEMVPVSHFAYQEPSDDPRAFCYVWAMYSNDMESKNPSVPLATMYSLAYETKETIEDYGVLYQNFISCSLRFQMDLLPPSEMATSSGGYCVSLQTLMSSLYLDNVSDHNLTLCMLVWCTWPACPDDPPGVVMAIIDLDQWYKEQMPATLRDRGNESYIAQFNLSRMLNLDHNSLLFNINIEPSSISPFTTVQRLEEHYYPTALTFDFIAMQKSHFTFIKNDGLQRTLLLALEQSGVNGFLNADNLARQCADAGLHPINIELMSPKPLSSHCQLLSLALEYNLIGLLTTCAQKWATGAYASAGCTLGVFVEWASQRSEILQQKANELCISLFDYSDINLDCNARKILDQCAIQMHHLTSIFKIINKNCFDYLNDEAKAEINEQLRAIQMFSDRLEVLQWLLNVGLLPEAPLNSYAKLTDTNGRMRAPYPVDELFKYYKHRRKHLNELNEGAIASTDSSTTGPSNKFCELLFIDNLIEHEFGGERLRQEWMHEMNPDGCYPPPSIQALLRTYLIDNVRLEIKHTILVYVFLDLAMTLDQTKYASIVTHLIKFPAVFRLTPCHIKMAQAYWQLDHGDFETGMEQLLDPLIGSAAQDEFKPWQHRMVLQTLLVNKQHKFAALYIQVRQPPFTDLNEICNAMHLLLSNNMLHTAFEFQRRHQTLHNKILILEKFFEGCLKENLITSALKLSLSTEEEDVLIQVLRKQKKTGRNLQLMYYLQRSRGYDAMNIGEKYLKDNNLSKIGPKGLIGQHSGELPQLLLSTFSSYMPKISKSIYTSFQSDAKEFSKKEVKAPAPMSFKIHEVHTNIKYRSNTILNSLNKIREVWSEENKSDDKSLESMPFLCKPKRRQIGPLLQTTPVSHPKITYHSQNINEKKRAGDSMEELIMSEPRPSKRLKFSNDSLALQATPIYREHTAPEKLLLTPIVKRKYSESPKRGDSLTVPQSILKIRPLEIDTKPGRDGSITPNLEDCADSVSVKSSTSSVLVVDQQSDDDVEPISSSEIKVTDSVLGATPRKNLIRTPRPAVHFEDSFTGETVPTPLGDVDEEETLETPMLDNAASSTLNESVLREQEINSVARKLIRSTSSPYKSVKPRKSLQRAVLEGSLVKNVTLTRSKRIASRTSSNASDSGKDTDEEGSAFEKNVTACSSPSVSIATPRNTLRENFPEDDVHVKQLNDSNVTDSFIKRMDDKYRKTSSDTTSDEYSFECPKPRWIRLDDIEARASVGSALKVDEISISTTMEEIKTTSFGGQSIQEDSLASESLIMRVEKLYGYGQECNKTNTTFMDATPTCDETVASNAEVNVQVDEHQSEIKTDIDQFCDRLNDSNVSESFIARMDAKYQVDKSSDETSGNDYSFECPKMVSKRLDDIVTTSIKPALEDISEISGGEQFVKDVTLQTWSGLEDSVVTKSLIERVEERFGYGQDENPQDTSEVLSSKDTSSVYCSIEETSDMGDLENDEVPNLSEDDDFKLRMEEDDDVQQKTEGEVDEDVQKKTEGDVEESVQHEDQSDADNNVQNVEIVEISSDENSNDCSSKTTDDNSCDSNQSSHSSSKNTDDNSCESKQSSHSSSKNSCDNMREATTESDSKQSDDNSNESTSKQSSHSNDSSARNSCDNVCEVNVGRVGDVTEKSEKSIITVDDSKSIVIEVVELTETELYDHLEVDENYTVAEVESEDEGVVVGKDTENVSEENAPENINKENIPEKVYEENVPDKVNKENIPEKVIEENVPEKVDDEKVVDLSQEVEKKMRKTTPRKKYEQQDVENVEVGIRTRLRTRRSSTDSYKSESAVPVIKSATRSRRATSVDVTTPIAEKRVTRSSSDLNVSTTVPTKSPAVRRASIGTRRSSRTSKDGDVPSITIEDYSTSRRLTRKQKSMLEKIQLDTSKITPKIVEENEDSVSSDDGERDTEKIDPIILLDKQSFEGPADPDEQKLLRQPSPASSIKTTSSIQSLDNVDNQPTLRKLRSRSIDLDVRTPTKVRMSSSNSDIIEASTPPRRMSRRLSQLSLTKTPEKGEGSDESVISQMSTRSKSTAKLSPEVRQSPRRSTRLGSPQILDEPKSHRRSILQSDLPVISEENVEHNALKRKKMQKDDVDASPAKRRNSKAEESKTTTTTRRKKV